MSGSDHDLSIPPQSLDGHTEDDHVGDSQETQQAGAPLEDEANAQGDDQQQKQKTESVSGPVTNESTDTLEEERRLQGTRPKYNRRPARRQKDAMRQPAATSEELASFDWDGFENRYQKAIDEANEKDQALLDEFELLVRYFHVWASAASAHDDERAIKRLQTRSRYVEIHEKSLEQKKQHLGEVVKAFESALALLSQM